VLIQVPVEAGGEVVREEALLNTTRPRHANAVPLIEVLRDGVVESVHWAHVVISNAQGHRILTWGDPDRTGPGRGCLTPFQALPIFLDQIDETRAITPLEMAIILGSHAGQEVHQEAVRSLLRRVFLTPDHLILRQPKGAPSRLAHRCSGKHAAMIVHTRVSGNDVGCYAHPEAPVHHRILTELLKLTRLIRSQVPLVVEDCGVPVACLSLERMAHLYAVLAAPSIAGGHAASALGRMVSAWSPHPECLEGEGLFDTEIVRVTSGQILARTGPSGMICAALKDQKLGVAIKVESSVSGLARRLLARVLGHLGVFSEATEELLSKLATCGSRSFSGPFEKNLRFQLPD